MDPNENLRLQLRISKSIMAAIDKGKSVDEEDANRLAELVESLDQWILRGGFLPKRWKR